MYPNSVLEDDLNLNNNKNKNKWKLQAIVANSSDFYDIHSISLFIGFYRLPWPMMITAKWK